MKQIVLLALLFSLAGCVKIITDDLETKPPKLVLNSAISTDSALTINLSRTFNIFDDESDKNLPFIDGANVGFFENGNWLFDLENLGYGYYAKPGFYPETGKDYSVEASYKGFTSIASKTVIPPAVPILDFDTTELLVEYEYYGKETWYIGHIKYKDPAGIGNDYQLTCRIWARDGNGGKIWSDNYLWIPETEDHLFYDNAYGNLLWNDKFSDGKEVDIRFVFFNIYDNKSSGFVESDTLGFVFSFQALNNDYYTYLKSLNIYYDTGGGEDPFSEPVVIYSNIENGYGIFGGFGQDTASTRVVVNYNYQKGGRQ